MKNLQLVNKIQATHSGELLKKFASKTITEEEISKLLMNLNFKDLNEFKNYSKEIQIAAQVLQIKFPKLIESVNKKEIIASAINSNETLVKHIKSTSNFYPIEDCLYVLALANLCWTLYPNDFDMAFNCWLLHLGGFDLCVIFSD